MNRLKIVPALMLAGVMAAGSLSPALAADTEDFSFYVNNDGLMIITKYTGDDEVLEIPSALDGFAVSEIGDHSFCFCYGLVEVTIPSTVTALRASAFAFCGDLESVTIPSSVTTIESEAFYDCYSLKSIIIPASVTSIADEIFSDVSTELVLYVEQGSYAEEYAMTHGLTYAYIEAEDAGTGTYSYEAVTEENAEAIRLIQQRLGEMGYYFGEADGVLGDQTKEAIRAFQTDSGMDADGVIGPKLMQALGLNY